jgi:hypothetical protein
MAVNLSALAGAGQQFFDNNGDPLTGGKLYSYEAGTTTPQVTYTSVSGATAHTNPIVLNSAGRVATGEIWLTAGQNYKFVLKTSVDVTIATWDNITGINGTGITSNAVNVEYDPPFTGAVTNNYTVQDKLAQTISVMDFGAAGDGVTDDTAAFAAAVSYIVSQGGGTLYMPHAQYLLNGTTGADGIVNGIVLPFTGGSDTGATAISVNLIGADRDTTLLAGTNNMIVVRCSTSYSEIGSFQILANSKTGVQGIALIPENTTTPNLNSQQSFNTVRDFYISACAEGVVLQCGGNGGAYYNQIGPGHVHGSSLSGTRGVWLKSGVGTGTPSNANRNHFISVRVGFANTGFEVESGDTNRFTGCAVEGILAGTSPNATPTGVKVLAVDLNGRGNQGCTFFGFVAESCTRDAEILDPRTSFFGFVLDASKTILAADFVSGQNGTMIGSYDSTVFPNIYAGTLEYGSLLPAGIGAYEFGSNRTNLEYFDKGYKYKSFALSTSNVTGVNSIGESKSYYTKLANMVDWSFRFDFNPTSSSVVLTIPLPVTAFLQAYATLNTINPFTFLVRLSAGASEVVGFAEVNWESPAGTFLKIRLPAGTTWDTSAGNNNRIDCAIRYRAA